MGDLIALTYVLTIEDPHRFRKSRDAGCFVGLQPGRRNSGDSEPQMHISKQGDEYLRTLLVRERTTFWDPLGKTVLYGAGDRGLPSEEEKTSRTDRAIRRIGQLPV